MRKLIFAVFFVLVASIAHAQLDARRIYGPITNNVPWSCGRFTAVHKGTGEQNELDATVMDWWVVGFVSGAGWAGTKLNDNDVAGLDEWMNHYCEAHPLTSIIQAAMELVKTLRPNSTPPAK